MAGNSSKTFDIMYNNNNKILFGRKYEKILSESLILAYPSLRIRRLNVMDCFLFLALVHTYTRCTTRFVIIYKPGAMVLLTYIL